MNLEIFVEADPYLLHFVLDASVKLFLTLFLILNIVCSFYQLIIDILGSSLQ